MMKTIKEHIGQVILIAFSVVLGLYLSERIEESKNKKESSKLLSAIKSEVESNLKILEEWAPYHREIKESMDSLCSSESFIEEFIKDKSSLFEKLLTRGTFMEEQPTSEAWEIAKTHPLIVNIDYDQLLILSKINNQLKITFEPFPKMYAVYQSVDVNSEENAKQNLSIMRDYMQELVGREMSLMTFYREAKAILGLGKE